LVGGAEVGHGCDEVGDSLDGVEAADEADAKTVGPGYPRDGSEVIDVDGVGDEDEFLFRYVGALSGGLGDGGTGDDDLKGGVMDGALHRPVPPGVGLGRLDRLEPAHSGYEPGRDGSNEVGVQEQAVDVV